MQQDISHFLRMSNLENSEEFVALYVYVCDGGRCTASVSRSVSLGPQSTPPSVTSSHSAFGTGSLAGQKQVLRYEQPIPHDITAVLLYGGADAVQFEVRNHEGEQQPSVLQAKRAQRGRGPSTALGLSPRLVARNVSLFGRTWKQ